VFYFNTEPRLKWNKTILADKTILFHVRRGSMLKWNIVKFLKIILFHFMMKSSTLIGRPHTRSLYAAVAPCNMDTKATMASLWCLLFLSTAAVNVLGLDRAEFSASLQRAVNDLLGSGQYQVKHKFLFLLLLVLSPSPPSSSSWPT